MQSKAKIYGIYGTFVFLWFSLLLYLSPEPPELTDPTTFLLVISTVILSMVITALIFYCLYKAYIRTKEYYKVSRLKTCIDFVLREMIKLHI